VRKRERQRERERVRDRQREGLTKKTRSRATIAAQRASQVHRVARVTDVKQGHAPKANVISDFHHNQGESAKRFATHGYVPGRKGLFLVLVGDFAYEGGTVLHIDRGICLSGCTSAADDCSHSLPGWGVRGGYCRRSFLRDRE
jgi:hypothetical protein